MLSIKNLSHQYGNIKAVDDLSLEIHQGESFGLLGPNGAGKSTTISICTGLLTPTSGEVRLADGATPSKPEARRKMGVAPQTLALYEDLTAIENLKFFARLYGLENQKILRRLDEIMEFVGLTDRARELVSSYSGGMKRRLNLAAALIHEPEIVFMDEPTAGVDPQSRNLLLEQIAHLRDGGMTVVYSTHYMEEAERLCDRVGIIDHGKLIALDTVQNLIAQHGGDPLITANIDGVPHREHSSDPVATMARLQEKGKLTEFNMQTPGLEAVFLNLTGRKVRDS